MVRINKIYTRTGDDGSTGLVDGSRVSKDSLRVSAYGEIDELNSQLGLIRSLVSQQGLAELSTRLETIQSDLFDIGSALATPAGFNKYPVFEVKDSDILKLEQWIDQAVDNLPALKSFVLPGGTPLNAQLHIARAVARRAERSLITLAKQEKVQDRIIVYCNRLSDLLFALSRQESYRAKVEEYLWVPAGKRL